MTRSAPLLAAGCAALLLAAACTSGDDPKPNYSSVSSTPTSPSPTPTTSSPSTSIPATGPNVNPGEVPPTEPASAALNDSAGALAFVGYYIRTLDWVYATSRPDLLTPFYAASCSTCRDGQSAIERFVATGVIKGGRLMVKRIAVVANDHRNGAQVAISTNYAVTAASVVTSSGVTATSFPAGNDITLTEWMSWNEDRWTILEERYA